jgi:hypothetical protein
MRRLALVLLVAFSAGCGGSRPVDRQATDQRQARAPESRACAAAAPGFRACAYSSAGKPHPTIERQTGSTWTVVTGPLKPADPTTEWGAKVWLSPDAQTLLAEWEYACDGRIAVFVSARNGKPRIVTGEQDWRMAVPSEPLGWTRDGKARVRVYDAWGTHGTHPAGIYLFDPHGRPPKATKHVKGC